MKKNILFTIFSMSFLISFSQIKGVVFDFETSEPIPYVNISIKESDFGTTSNEKGEFIIKENTENAFLVISSIGYENALIEASKKEIEIYLKPKTYEIAEVLIKPSKDKSLTINSLKRKRSRHTFACGGKAWIVAKHFKQKPEYYKAPYIKEIKILTNSEINNAMFNVRLLSSNENNEPSVEIYHENIIAYAKKGRKIVSIKLSDKYIEFPKNGLFIALEWLVIEENKYRFTYIMDGSKKNYEGTSYAPGFSAFKMQGESDTWSYIGGKWTRIVDTRDENVYRGLAIELTLTN